MTRLIGLTGLKGSGKDTAFLGIQNWAEKRRRSAARRGFADKLKLACCRLFYPDCTQEFALQWADYIKRDPTVEWSGELVFNDTEALEPRKAHDLRSNSIYHVLEAEDGTHLSQVTGRQLLQRFGTEAARDVYGDNFWVDQLLPQSGWQESFVQALDDPHGDLIPHYCVITDLRFPNEAARIKSLGGQIWKIDRKAVESDDVHASEKPLDMKYVDVVIHNNNTLEAFGEAVHRTCVNAGL